MPESREDSTAAISMARDWLATSPRERASRRMQATPLIEALLAELAELQAKCVSLRRAWEGAEQDANERGEYVMQMKAELAQLRAVAAPVPQQDERIEALLRLADDNSHFDLGQHCTCSQTTRTKAIAKLRALLRDGAPPEETALAHIALTTGEIKGLADYIEWNGGAHAEWCPADDTCDCIAKPMNDAVNSIYRKAVAASSRAPQEPTGK